MKNIPVYDIVGFIFPTDQFTAGKILSVDWQDPIDESIVYMHDKDLGIKAFRLSQLEWPENRWFVKCPYRSL